ncbi:uncharacterized protein IUM83_14944 [Phytophthora cinnamomi]|uniref:uncharacterized protein n=1 Tax=Phytophthora cinnamomi TaxID=4785 RepID=UPI00355A511A|nr:hypothetical protein IUM83_14944 [Phytophthora cinnamomi]
MSIVHLFTNSNQHSATPEELAAEAHALTVKPLPGGATAERQFRCIGWRATAGCNADGTRDLANDKACNRLVEDGASGYCEIEDVDSGERFRVMRRGCSTVKKGAKFYCSDAPDFANFAVKARQAVAKAVGPGFNLPNVKQHDPPKAGIVMVVYPNLLASAYASVRTLREVFKCRLPIEIWYRNDELRRVPGALEPLRELAEKDGPGGITFREITDQRALRFAAKVHAVYNSNFDQHDANGDVLFLHRNSNKLTGKIKREEINYDVEARKQARLKLLDKGLPVVLNDELVQAEREVLMRTPPATLEPLEADNLPDPAMWTHLWSFRNTSRRIDYKIRSYSAEPDFPKWQRCYGQRHISDNEHFYAQTIANLSFSGLETHLRRFAMEGAQLLENHQASTNTK